MLVFSEDNVHAQLVGARNETAFAAQPLTLEKFDDNCTRQTCLDVEVRSARLNGKISRWIARQ